MWFFYKVVWDFFFLSNWFKRCEERSCNIFYDWNFKLYIVVFIVILLCLGSMGGYYIYVWILGVKDFY